MNLQGTRNLEFRTTPKMKNFMTSNNKYVQNVFLLTENFLVLISEFVP